MLNLPYMEVIIGAICFTAGVLLAKLAVEYRWKSNADVPARLLLGKTFYKVVRLDSNESWKMLRIHQEIVDNK